MDSDQYLSRLEGFLATPLPKSLLAAHPNDVANPSFALPPEWEAWWDWAASASVTEPWIELLGYYVMEQRSSGAIPSALSQLIDNVKALQLIRSQGHPPVPAGHRAQLREARYAGLSQYCTRASVRGMSPKKSHEVSAMTAHVVQLLRTSPALKSVRHVVDIGAGQGYLSWNLRALGMHVLALDVSDTQAKGAERQRSHHKSSSDQGSLTYRVGNITPDTLLRFVDEWITSLSLDAGSHLPSVVFVALHACGSLTPDILRTSVSAMLGNDRGGCGWSLKGAIVIGCCYNVMGGKDFPLSSGISGNGFSLSSSHLQLAAQVPSVWLDDRARTRIALRKVSWRALLEAATAESDPAGGCPPSQNRLGRVSDSSCHNWEQFLRTSSVKLHKKPVQGMESFPEKLAKLEKQISTLHTLRCLLGPCVESLIVWDRYTWLKEVSRDGTCFEAHLLNLFDQNQASSRNISITMISR